MWVIRRRVRDATGSLHKYLATVACALVSQLDKSQAFVMGSSYHGNNCGYCHACVRMRLNAARGRNPEPLECAYKHILESYGEASQQVGKVPESPKPVCASCRWTSDAQFPETPPLVSDLSLEWSSRSSHRSRSRRRNR